MFKGTVCVCRCVHVFVFMQLHVRRYQSLRSFAGRTHMAQQSATFLFWVKMLHLRHVSLMMSARAQTIHTLWAESQIKEHIFLTVEFRNTCSRNAKNRGNDWFIFNFSSKGVFLHVQEIHFLQSYWIFIRFGITSSYCSSCWRNHFMAVHPAVKYSCISACEALTDRD